MAQTETVKLEIPRSARYVTLARKAVECIGLRVRLTDDEIGDLKLAVGEACTNAVKFGDPCSTFVCVSYRLEPDKLQIQVRNSGEPFTWIRPNSDRLALAQIPEGGLGLFLIEQLVDEMIIESADGETAITMTKWIEQ